MEKLIIIINVGIILANAVRDITEREFNETNFRIMKEVAKVASVLFGSFDDTILMMGKISRKIPTHPAFVSKYFFLLVFYSVWFLGRLLCI